MTDLGFPGDGFLDVAWVKTDSVIHATGIVCGEAGVEIPIVRAGADGDNPRDTSGGGAIKHGGQVAPAGEFCEMAMGVDKHGECLVF